MMKTTTHEIKFTVTKRGTRRAYYFSRACFRWMPIGVEQAELEIATGKATLAGDKRIPTANEKGQQ